MVPMMTAVFFFFFNLGQVYLSLPTIPICVAVPDVCFYQEQKDILKLTVVDRNTPLLIFLKFGSMVNADGNLDYEDRRIVQIRVLAVSC